MGAFLRRRKIDVHIDEGGEREAPIGAVDLNRLQDSRDADLVEFEGVSSPFALDVTGNNRASSGATGRRV